MAGISLSTNFDVGAALHLDSREEITKAEMLTINENIYPDDLLVICSDDHKVYLFSKSNESDPETGKFREFKTGTEITVDDEMSLTSENPVQNKVICIALNGKVGIEDTMPTPSADYLGTIGIYGGETTSDYTHGYFYECKRTGDVEGVINFEPHKIGFEYEGHAVKDIFVDNNITDYDTITHGTMTYMEAGNIWALTGYDENDTEVFSGLQLYTEDLESYGFVFIYPMSEFSDGEVLDYDILWNSTYTYSWEPLKVQENTIESISVNGTPIAPVDGNVDITVGDSSTTEDVTANTTVGGISSGDTVLEGTTLTDVLKKLLIIEIAPTVSFSSTNSGVREEGTSVTPTMTFTISNAGTGTPVSISFYSGSTLLDTQDYVSGTNTYTYTMETAISTDTTVKGVLSYKKSDDSNATIEKTASYTFVMASYYGAVSTAPTTQADIIALTKAVKNTKAYTTTYVLSNQKSCYCYPASFGNLTSIKDANNFEYIQSYTKTNVSVDGVSYNVYTLTDPVTIASFKQIFA